jgi:hypothetical protein
VAVSDYYWQVKATVGPRKKGYDPNQPRVPAGDPRGGQWTSDGGSFSAQVVNSAVQKVQSLTLHSRQISEPFSDEEIQFLKGTVDDKTYKLYRGMGIIKARVDRENRKHINSLKPGDEVPDYLSKQDNPYASYTKKVSVARAYSEGQIKLIIEAKVQPDRVIADLANLGKFLDGIGHGDLLSSWDREYFKDEKEVLVMEPVAGTIRNISGRVSL